MVYGICLFFYFLEDEDDDMIMFTIIGKILSTISNILNTYWINTSFDCFRRQFSFVNRIRDTV